MKVDNMKKKNKGFVFIETIITVVVLSTSLLYLYSSYSNIITREETRLYYDDPAYIYRTNYVRKFLEQYTNLEEIKSYAFNNSYVITIGTGFDNMFTSEQIANNMASSMENMINNFRINQMLIVDSYMLDECLGTNDDSTKCKVSTSNLSYNLNNYIKTLNELDYNYYLIVEYSEHLSNGKVSKCVPGTDRGCDLYYVSLGI